MTRTDFARKELFELVWEKPLRHFIEHYGGTFAEGEMLLKKYCTYYHQMGIGYN